MSIITATILYCDGQGCSSEVRRYGHTKKKELRNYADENRWFIYNRSTFCPLCRKAVEDFLKNGSGGNHASQENGE